MQLQTIAPLLLAIFLVIYNSGPGKKSVLCVVSRIVDQETKFKCLWYLFRVFFRQKGKTNVNNLLSGLELKDNIQKRISHISRQQLCSEFRKISLETARRLYGPQLQINRGAFSETLRNLSLAISRGVKLTTHFKLVPRSRMVEQYPPLPNTSPGYVDTVGYI
jgi:hypothetical protein